MSQYIQTYLNHLQGIYIYISNLNYFENWISNTNMTIVIIIGKSEDKHISFFQCFVIGLKVIGIILELVFSNSLDFRQILTFY